LKSFWNKINIAVNESLLSYNVEKTVQTIDLLQRIGKKNINIPEATKEQFTQYLLNDVDVFKKVVNDNNMFQVAEITKRDYSKLFFEYIAEHPEDFNQFYSILEKIFLSSPKELFSELIELSQKTNNYNSSLLSGISPIIEKYFCSKNSFEAIEEFNAMMVKIPIETHNHLIVGNIPDSFLSYIRKNPKKEMKSTIEKLSNFDYLIIEENDRKSFATLLVIMNDEIPEEVTEKEMLLIYKLGNKTSMKKTFYKWINEGFTFTANEFKSFLKEANYLEGESSFIEFIVVAIWKSPNPSVVSIREELVKTVLDQAKWDKNSYLDFIKRNDPKDLVEFLSKSSGFVAKVLSFFKK